MDVGEKRYPPGVYIIENSVAGTALDYMADYKPYQIDDRASVTIVIHNVLRANNTLSVFKISDKADNIINVAYNT